jgi:hypothetical protein
MKNEVGRVGVGTDTKLSTFLHFFYLPQVMQVKSGKNNIICVSKWQVKHR